MSTGEVKKIEPIQLFHTYPLCKISDMPDDVKQEAMEISVTAAEKYSDNYELAAKMIKQSLDKKFGSPFQVVVGESYGFFLTHQENMLIYMFTSGNIAVLIWRTAAGY